MQVTKI